MVGRKGSAKVLESLEESNLLLVPLDRRREWYRYHHLFRDVLRSELERGEPDAIPGLHRRAADWFEANGMLEQAMEHARGQQDPERVARLFQQELVPLNRSGRFATLHRWLGYLGSEMVGRFPSLAVSAAWVSVLSGDARAADRWTDLAFRAPATGRRPMGARARVRLWRCSARSPPAAAPRRCSRTPGWPSRRSR